MEVVWFKAHYPIKHWRERVIVHKMLDAMTRSIKMLRIVIERSWNDASDLRRCNCLIWCWDGVFIKLRRLSDCPHRWLEDWTKVTHKTTSLETPGATLNSGASWTTSLELSQEVNLCSKPWTSLNTRKQQSFSSRYPILSISSTDTWAFRSLLSSRWPEAYSQ